MNPTEALRVSAIIYGVSLLISLTPISEEIAKLKMGVTPLKLNHDKDRLQPIFNDVYERARETDKHLSRNIKLYVIEPSKKQEYNGVNAFALGNSTLILTREAIETLSNGELMGTIAHEFGHFSNRDSFGMCFLTTGNLLFNLMYICVRAIANMLHFIFSNRGIGLIRYLWYPVLYTFKFIVFIGNVILMPISRIQEYNADRFAIECDHGTDLLDLLNTLYRIYGEEAKAFLDFANRTHPYLSDRIARLESFDMQSLPKRIQKDDVVSKGKETLSKIKEKMKSKKPIEPQQETKPNTEDLPLLMKEDSEVKNAIQEQELKPTETKEISPVQKQENVSNYKPKHEAKDKQRASADIDYSQVETIYYDEKIGRVRVFFKDGNQSYSGKLEKEIGEEYAKYLSKNIPASENIPDTTEENDTPSTKTDTIVDPIADIENLNVILKKKAKKPFNPTGKI